jgi:thymidylate synthase (FAD)
MITISEYTTKTPLKMIGEFAGLCWGANTKDNEKNIKRAIDCIMSDHGRTEEFPDVYLIIDGNSAKCLRELYTHIGGAPTRLQASTRYIDYEKKGVPVITPPSVANKELAKEAWDETIEAIKKGMNTLKAFGIPNEDVTNLLPLAYQSKMVWKVNLRTLINFMNKRLCTRAYWEIREASLELKKLLSEYSDEWKKITDMLFVPTCEKYKFINKDFCFCTETKCCNRHPHISKLKIVSIDSEDDGR